MQLLTAHAGAIVVKALVLTAVERLSAAGFGKMYSGWPQTWQQVSCTATSHGRPPASDPLVCGQVTVAEQPQALKHVGKNVGATSLDPRFSLQGGYMVLTVVALDYLHDAWFYWTHRLLHWKPLYRHVHHLHHRCAITG